jgi:small-conductance mechanosensitive channel
MPKQWQAASEAMERLLEPANLVQVTVIAAMVILGWWIAERIRRDLGVVNAPAGWRGRAREAAWVAAPFGLTLLLLATADGLLHAIRAPTRIVDVAVQLTGLLLLIRVVVYLFRVSLGTRSRIKGWGTPISVVIWIFLSLHLLGWGDTLIGVLDGIGINAGKTRISVWSITKLLVTVGLFVVVAVWLSRWLEKRLMSLQGIAPNMRIGLAKFTQAFLV